MSFVGVDIKQFRKIQVFDGEKEADEIIGVGGFAVVRNKITILLTNSRWKLQINEKHPRGRQIIGIEPRGNEDKHF